MSLRHPEAANWSQTEIDRLYADRILHELASQMSISVLGMAQTVQNSYEDRMCHIDAKLEVEGRLTQIHIDFRGRLLKHWLTYQEITISNPQLEQPESDFDWYVFYVISKHPDGEISRAKIVDGPRFRQLWRDRETEDFIPNSDRDDGKGQRILGWDVKRMRSRGLLLAEWRASSSAPAPSPS